MARFLLILVAFSILNQSIDLDYLTWATVSRQSRANDYDDIDSITEYVIEEIVGDDGYIPEQDDDSDDMPKNNGVEKFSWNPLCCQYFQKVIVIPTNNTDQASQRSKQQEYPTCKGYGSIVLPPPDLTAI